MYLAWNSVLAALTATAVQATPSSFSCAPKLLATSPKPLKPLIVHLRSTKLRHPGGSCAAEQARELFCASEIAEIGRQPHCTPPRKDLTRGLSFLNSFFCTSTPRTQSEIGHSQGAARSGALPQCCTGRIGFGFIGAIELIITIRVTFC